MRISVDVKCYKTSDNGTVLTALLTEDAILMIEPEKQPTKHHGYVIISKDVSPAILGNIVWNMHQAAESRRLAATCPEEWIVVPVDWET